LVARDRFAPGTGSVQTASASVQRLGSLHPATLDKAVEMKVSFYPAP
jgi:hypothetical protein